MRKKSPLIIFSSLVCVVVFYFISERYLTTFTSTENNFVANEISPGSKSTYKLSLKLNENETVNVEAEIRITNISDEKWDKLVMYFIPNIFTKENSPALEQPASIDIHSLKLDGTTSDYSLEKDTLTLPLQTKISPNTSVTVQVNYELSLPTEGLRFTKVGDDLHLAQWYPMVPTYRNGWNKQDYQSRGETYHTPFSNFYLEVEVPSSYTVVSSSDEDDLLGNYGTEVVIENEKEIFLALLKKASPIEKKTSINNVNVRVFGSDERIEQSKEVLETAVKALDFFQKEFGAYKTKQFDVVIGGLGMEYPNVVTVGSIYNSKPVDKDSLKRMVVHEVAHQWFYGMVSNDPYKDAWLDEGLAEIATLLYFLEFEERDVTFSFDNHFSKELTLPVNLPLNQYPDGNQSSYIYGKASTELGMFLEKYGGEEAAKDFLKAYFNKYQYKEVNSIEFVRFANHYFKLADNKEFEEWLNLNEE